MLVSIAMLGYQRLIIMIVTIPIIVITDHNIKIY